jgi:hypothetical protein
VGTTFGLYIITLLRPQLLISMDSQHTQATDSVETFYFALPATTSESCSPTKTLSRTPTEPDVPAVNRPGALTRQNALFFEFHDDSDGTDDHYNTGKVKRARIAPGREIGGSIAN